MKITITVDTDMFAAAWAGDAQYVHDTLIEVLGSVTDGRNPLMGEPVLKAGDSFELKQDPDICVGKVEVTS